MLYMLLHSWQQSATMARWRVPESSALATAAIEHYNYIAAGERRRLRVNDTSHHCLMLFCYYERGDGDWLIIIGLRHTLPLLTDGHIMVADDELLIRISRRYVCWPEIVLLLRWP